MRDRIKSMMTPIVSFGLLLSCGDDRGASLSPQPPLSGPAEPPPPAACVEALAETTRAVDIILTMDQSSSMSEEIDSLQKNVNLLPSLLAETGLDYRVVMMAGMGRGSFDVCVPPPLGGTNCGSNGSVFLPVDQRVESKDTLMLLLVTLDHPTLSWHAFLRPGVRKIFVPITDDDSKLAGQEFDSALLESHPALFGTRTSRNYSVYPILGSDDFPSAARCATSSLAGHEYQYLAQLTNGRWYSVCRPSLQPVLEEIGRATREAVSCELAVPEPPASVTLNLDQMNVRVMLSSGEPVIVPQDMARPCSNGADGWQFSDDRRKVLLCGNACNLVKTEPNAKFAVGFGCTTITR